jgi:hypothetical protein
MFSIKSFFIAAVGLFAIIFAMCSNEQKPSAVTSNIAYIPWVPVNEDDWGIYKDVPNYHFSLAKQYLQQGNYSKAASELKLGNSFLIFQNYRLAAAAKQIKVLSDSVEAGKYKDIDKLDAVTSNAIKIIDNRYAMVPVMDKVTSVFNIDSSYTMAPVEVNADSIFNEEFSYHFDRAKSKLQENDQAGAASEITKAGSFLRLKAAAIGTIAQAQLDSAGNELKELASNVKSGTVKDVSALDRVFQNAKHIGSNRPAAR